MALKNPKENEWTKENLTSLLQSLHTLMRIHLAATVTMSWFQTVICSATVCLFLSCGPCDTLAVACDTPVTIIVRNSNSFQTNQSRSNWIVPEDEVHSNIHLSGCSMIKMSTQVDNAIKETIESGLPTRTEYLHFFYAISHGVRCWTKPEKLNGNCFTFIISRNSQRF